MAATDSSKGNVLLGDIGRSLPEDEQLNLGLSRLGGDPVWARLPPATALARRGCKQPCSFLGQISAPYESAPCRVLYLFGCLDSGCGSDSGAWRVLRCVESAPVEPSGPPAARAPDAGGVTDDDWSKGVADDDWSKGVTDDDWSKGVADDDWGLPPETTKTTETGGGMDAELAGLIAAQQAGKDAAKSKDCSAAPAEEQGQWWLGVRGPLGEEAPWPCFALTIYEEPPAVPKSGAREMELLERYRDSERSTGDEIEPEQPPEVAPEVGDAEDGDVEDMDKHMFMKFQRRLERSPTQVLRYCWGGKPLWISEPPEEVRSPAWPPPCSRCGAPRVFEAQLLPTLLYEVQRRCPERAAEAEIDMGTVVIYTCSKDCAGEGEPCEELVVVQPAV